MPLAPEEIEEIREILGREPTVEELAMFEAQWSEHCSYKSSKFYLRLLPTTGKDVLIGPGRDAPAVRIFNDYVVVFKIESHNHPSAIDPYNGAATGVGGIVRDILTLGARPIALLDLLFLGDPGDPHANWLIRNIVKGISDYGNRIGVPVVAGVTWFDKSFNRQPLVNIACVGIAKIKNLINGKPSPGDLILIVGNSTGRDGILGSSFASKPLNSASDDDIAAIQVGNPLIEKLLIDAIVELAEKGLVKYVKDLGGGGLATAISELTADHGLGAEILLDKLHTNDQSLTPMELLVSESQERMLLVVSEDNANEVNQVLNKYELQYSAIGYLDNSGTIKVLYKGKLVANLPAKELARPRIKVRDISIPDEVKILSKEVRVPEPNDLSKAFYDVMTSPNVVSKKWIYEQYDYEVGVRTVIKPGHGDAAVLRLLTDGYQGIAVKGDGNPRYTYIDPFRGAANVVAESFRNLIAVGSKPIAIVDEINAGNPEKPTHYWYFTQMVKGIAWMAHELRLPVVGGKVSFYNEDLSTGKQVKPTATIVGVGFIDDVRRSMTIGFKNAGDAIIIIGTTYPELGGSEYLYRHYGLEYGEVPVPRPLSEHMNGAFVNKLISLGIASAVHDIDIGGLAVAISEMSIQSLRGVIVDLSKVPTRGCNRFDEIMFSETQARYLVEVSEENIGKVLELADAYGIDIGIIGKVTNNNDIVFTYAGNELLRVNVNKLAQLYEDTLNFLIEG